MTAGISNKKLKAILIDLDGTMFDTAPEIAVAMNQTLQALNFKPLSFNTIRQFIGKGVDNLVNQSLLASMRLSRANMFRSYRKQVPIMGRKKRLMRIVTTIDTIW